MEIKLEFVLLVFVVAIGFSGLVAADQTSVTQTITHKSKQTIEHEITEKVTTTTTADDKLAGRTQFINFGPVGQI